MLVFVLGCGEYLDAKVPLITCDSSSRDGDLYFIRLGDLGGLSEM